MMNTSENIIIPSTSLKCVNCHKLADCSCSRYYYWRWIRNLVPKAFNINFWFGSMMHAGIEQVGLQAKLSKVLKAMRKSDMETCEKNAPTLDMNTELDVQREIGKLMIKQYRKIIGNKMAKLKLSGAEMPFRYGLKESPVIYTGQVDALYTEHRYYVLFEGKTASQITDKYFRRLLFDKQINGYAAGVKQVKGRLPRMCYYTVFRKPQIRQTKKESKDQFLERLKDDLKARKDWYFIFYPHRFLKNAVNSVINDIEWMTFDLSSKYDYLGEDQIMNPANWPRNDKQCFEYGVCPYFALCSRPSKYSLYLKYFRMRDIRYEEELEELNDKYAFETTAISRRKKGLLV